jgi:DNA-binding PadR family transcriptional regulator
LSYREEIEGSSENKKLHRGMYQITEKGKKRWLLLENMRKYNCRLQSSRGIDFEVPRLKEITFHTSTRDPTFYKKMLNNFAYLSKEKGRPLESVYFKGDTKLSLELTFSIFNGLSFS